MDELNNSYLAKVDRYPMLLDVTLTLLSNYQCHRAGALKVSDDDNEGLGEVSFAQYKRMMHKKKQLARTRCFKCNKLGHVKKDCPQRNQSHVQQENDSDDGSTGSTQQSGWSG